LYIWKIVSGFVQCRICFTAIFATLDMYMQLIYTMDYQVCRMAKNKTGKASQSCYNRVPA